MLLDRKHAYGELLLLDDLADFGRPIEHVENKPTAGIDLVVFELGAIQLIADLIETRRAKRAELRSVPFDWKSRCLSIGDLAHDLFKEILDGDNARRAAVLIDHDADLLLFTPHQTEHVVEARSLGEIGQLTDDLVGERTLFEKDIEEIPDENETDDVIDALFVNWITRMALSSKDGAELLGRCSPFDRDDLHARRHHLRGREIAEIKELGEDLARIFVELPLGDALFNDIAKIFLRRRLMLNASAHADHAEEECPERVHQENDGEKERIQKANE